MSDYQRFVSYLYEYHKNLKSASRGFARVEVRNRQCRIEIHMKLSPLPFTPLFQVCTFITKEDGLLGIPLGQATYQKGNVRASFVLSPEKLKELGISFANLDGLIIQSDLGQTYASVWKDITIQPEQLYFPEDKDSLKAASTTQPLDSITSTQMPDSIVSTQTPDSITSTQTPDSTASMQTPDNIASTQTPDSAASTQMPDSISSTQSSTILPKQHMETNSYSSAQSEMNSSIQTQTDSSTKTQSHTAPEPAAVNPWSWLQDTYPHVHPFFDDELQECVRVTLRDIPELTAHGFRIGANTFLNHSCQSFHHFLIGKMEDQQETFYILAAPGLFDENERLLAGLFHFPNFKPSRSALTRPGVFGYWYRTLN